MVKILKSENEVKKSNLVVLLSTKTDLKNFEFLNFSDPLNKKIEKIFSEKKNTVFSIFLGQDNFEEVYLVFYLDKTKNIYVFLGENISKIPDNISFFYDKNNYLLDSLVLGKYQYDKYLEEKNKSNINVIVDKLNTDHLNERLGTLENIISARDIVNTPASEKIPEKYEKVIKGVKFKNTKVKIVNFEEIKKLGLGLIEAVGQGSISEPRLVILERIIDKELPTIGFVGKGITFDTGGLNIKVQDYMYDMKCDMAGSAALLYMMKEIDEKELNCNIVCALSIAENSISGNSFRPGDILKSYSGKTVEVINTDAEGRLVLADGISYISKNYTLESITTIATLTGACMYALGYNYAGIMGDNKDFIKKLLNNPTFEEYWELPLDNFFIETTKGKISDFKNLSDNVLAGASMGGAFLKNFCLNNEKFLHLDIAGPSFVKTKYGLFNPGATGFGVESLSRLVINYNKNK